MIFSLILMFILQIAGQNYYEDDSKYVWYQIVSHKKECRCQLAIDINSFQQNCIGTRLVACPYHPNRKSQHWRWDGRMLISRVNGLAMDLKSPPGRDIVLAFPQDTPTQQFSTYLFDSHIYTNYEKFERPKVIDIHLRPTSLIGTNVTYYEMDPYNISNQMFDFRHVNTTKEIKFYYK
ncbi:hypothetical protein CHUAL_005210 [Chamberlinius hualienensis]